MSNKEATRALTEGLLAGYGGKTQFTRVNRGPFDLKSSHYEKDNMVYHDEWNNGGGQEIVRVGENMFTRVYAGGEADPELLKKFGTTHQEVISNLISRIQQLGDKTRLFTDCYPEDINGWSYEYKILDNDNQIPVTTGKEIIKFKNQIVFVHVFVLSAVTQ